MDFITDALLRQAALWRALMVGEEQTDTEKGGDFAKDEKREPPAQAKDRGADGAWGELARALSQRGTEARRAAATERAPAEEDPAPAGGANGFFSTGAPEQEFEAVRRLEQSWAVESARELSHVIELDSRRYDGGFSLY